MKQANDIPSDLMRAGEVADKIGITPQTLSRFRRLPGAPKRIDGKDSLQAWQQFMADRDNGAQPDKERLQCEKLEIEIQSMRVKHDALVGTLTPTADVEAFCVALGQTLRALMLKARNDLPPILEGLTAAEIKTRLARNEDEFFDAFDATFQRFADQLDERRVAEDAPEDGSGSAVGVDETKREGGQQRKKRTIRRRSTTVAKGAVKRSV